MLMIQGSLYIIDCCIWHAAAFEDVQPFLSCFLLGGILNQAINICPVFDTVAIGDETSVGLPLRETKAITKDTKESIVTATEKNVTIEGLVTPVWDNRCYREL